MNDVLFYDKLVPFFNKTQRRGQLDSKEVVLKINSFAFGDTLCATPTLRKLAEAYAKEIIVCSNEHNIFKHNPYVKFHINQKDFKEEYYDQYEVFSTYDCVGKRDKRGIECNYAGFDLRRAHSSDIGLDLSPEEMHCDYYPGLVKFGDVDAQFINENKYIAIHVTKTWPSRTWPQEKYEKLIEALNKAGYPVALVGADSPPEPGLWKSDRSCYDFEDLNFKGLSFINRTSLDEAYYVIKNSEAFITLDTGLLHLAGCTDTHIINIGSSVRPKFRIPYRHGSQKYKVDFVGGDCELFCASEPKYSVIEHGSANSIPPVPFCLEGKPTFECQPSAEKVIDVTLEVLNR